MPNDENFVPEEKAVSLYRLFGLANSDVWPQMSRAAAAAI